MRRIHLVMAERGGRIVHGTGAVHEGDRPERRCAHGVELDEDPAARHRSRPVRPEVHHEIVRMLIVDQRRILIRLAGLEHLW